MKSPLNRGGLRFYLVLIALIAGTLWAQTTSPRTILAGLTPLVAGILLHTWAKGCLRQNRVVAMIGPYRFVRHPFYLANALIDAALAIMSGWWPLVVVLPLWWLVIYLPVIRGEERYLTEHFPAEYPSYRQRVPCLFPWRLPLPYSGDGFLWSNPNIRGGEELPRAIRILAYPFLFFVVDGLRIAGPRWLDEGWNLAALSGLIMIHVVAWEVHGHQRQRRWILPATMRHPLLRVVVSTGLLAAVWFVPGPKTSYKNSLPAGGAILMLFSVPIYARRPFRVVMAELTALLGVIAAGELAWLAPVLVVTYTAWIFDFQLGQVEPALADVAAKCSRPFWPYFYPPLAIAAAAIIGIKLIGHGLPFHFPAE
jgi:protein-S-isoprenylcysteine O-methyltransferase Ste14